MYVTFFETVNDILNDGELVELSEILDDNEKEKELEEEIDFFSHLSKMNFQFSLNVSKRIKKEGCCFVDKYENKINTPPPELFLM